MAINSQNDFQSVVDRLVKDENVSKTKREQGTLFERLVAQILRTQTHFKDEFKEVYLWNEFNAKFNINSQDIGVDIMARTQNDEWVSVQCKAYEPSHTLQQGDLRNFLGINNITKSSSELFCEISQKLIFHTCKQESDNIKKALAQAKTSQSEAKSYGFYKLQEFNIDYESLNLDDLHSLKSQKKKDLRAYQQEALEKIKEHFLDKNEQRAKIIMACGTGKSLLAVRTIDEFVGANELCVFFAPSLALINQMLLEFYKESTSEGFKVFAVCSDSTVGANASNAIKETSEDLKASELFIPVISNPQNLANQVKHHNNKKIIIFSTYQSIDVIIEAQRLFKTPFKLIINDEAHRTAGFEKLDEKNNKIQSIWQKTHDNAQINAKFRLYLTATPRIYSDKAKEKTEQNDLMLYSMDDESIFGKEIYKLNFDEAIKQKILCDYRVLITFVNKDTTSAITNAKGKDYKADDISKMLGLYKAVLKQDLYLIDSNANDENESTKSVNLESFEDKEPMKRVVCFHHSIANSKFFAQNFAAVDEKHLNTSYTEHIDGTDNANEKSAKLAWLKESSDEAEFKILSNAKCLTEGIDVPNLDGVAFFDPRDSVVDIVQAVGRVMRKAEGKKLGYIILPLALSEEEIKDYDKVLKSSAFKGVWKILKALRSHDERLVDVSRINQVVKIATPKSNQAGGFTSENSTSEARIQDKTRQIQDSLFALNELSTQIKNAIPKNLGDLAYWELYAGKVGGIMHDLSARIKALVSANADIKAIFEKFCKALQANLNSSFDINEAISLIAQHIITKPIFNHIFPDLNFAKFDKVSFELDRLYAKLCEFGLESELKDLKPFYESVQKNAEFAQSDKAKQDLIRNLYDSLFKAAFSKVQEKLGIVYTPIEVVDFIIHSTEFALKKHFNKSLSDENVHILDPFTGTGSFITRLIQSELLGENLAQKYENELWANEITLLGYYIAQINITATYHKQMQALQNAQNNNDYKLLDNLLFTDTFESYTQDSKGYKGEQTLTEQGEYLKANLDKIKQFKKTDFKVIIGNPPYSAGQENANDDNANIKYDLLDSRIASTYVSAYKVQKFKYDSFKRAIRYATDRIESKGIVAFVTNGSFIEGKSDAGLRACLVAEFDFIYIFNLRGDIRKNMQTKEGIEGENIFGNASQTPVAISILIKCSKNETNKKAQIFHYDIKDTDARKTSDKLSLIHNLKSIANLENKWQLITPNQDYDWINQRDYNYLKFMSLGDKKLKFKPLKKGYEINLFEIFSMGLVSNRDAWVINFSKENLTKNMSFMIENYNKEVENLEKNSNSKPTMDSTKIKWTRALLNDFNKKLKFEFNDNGLIVSSHYRPFTKCYLYLAKHFNEMLYQMPQIYPTPQTKDINILDCGVETMSFIKDFAKQNKYLPNLSICIDEGGQTGAIITDLICDLHFCPQTQAFPLYYYEKIEPDQAKNLFDKGEVNDNDTYRRKDAIRDEALKEVQKIYKDENISKEDIFYYIYALLNHKGYKEKYKDNLSKMLPRIPFVKDFKEFARLGRELADLHLGYENFADKSTALSVPKDKIKDFSNDNLFADKGEAKALLENLNENDFRLNKMRFVVKGKKDTIIFNDKIAVVNVPLKAYEYVVNGRSGIEWIMERYQVKTDKDSGLINDPNLYECENGTLKGLKGGKYALALLLSVIQMSVLSVELLEKLAKYPLDEMKI